MFKLRTNCSVMMELPAELMDVIWFKPGHLSELALERRGDRRRHHVRTRARIIGQHLDGRIIHFRERRNRQLPIGDAAHQQQPHHQQSRGNRSLDKRAGRTHALSFFAAAPADSPPFGDAPLFGAPPLDRSLFPT